LALLATLEIISRDAIENAIALGESSLDGTLVPVRDALPATMAAAASEWVLICPDACGAEAAWVDQAQVIEADSLIQIIHHFNGQRLIAPALPGAVIMVEYPEDLRDIKGQERGKRALEIAVDGHHNLLLVGTPRCGKSMLAKRIYGLLPPLTPAQALATLMIDSISGAVREGNFPPATVSPHASHNLKNCGRGRRASRHARRNKFGTLMVCCSWMDLLNFPARS